MCEYLTLGSAPCCSIVRTRLSQTPGSSSPAQMWNGEAPSGNRQSGLAPSDNSCLAPLHAYTQMHTHNALMSQQGPHWCDTAEVKLMSKPLRLLHNSTRLIKCATRPSFIHEIYHERKREECIHKGLGLFFVFVLFVFFAAAL